jgi:lycopene epsilon-cyclase
MQGSTCFSNRAADAAPQHTSAAAPKDSHQLQHALIPLVCRAAVLKRRLERRLGAVGITVTKVHEEEWSYIPVGGPMPLQDQTITAFGAAANLVHPATGFSVTRSLREAPKLAAQIAEVLGKELPVGETSALVWQALWPVEKCRQASFHVFGMELLAALDLGATNDFFNTFFSLPSSYWRGFLASNLSSGQLVAFALLTFAIAPVGIKAKLVSHLLTDPAGQYLYKHYLGSSEEEGSPQQASAAAALLMFLGSSALRQQ